MDLGRGGDEIAFLTRSKPLLRCISALEITAVSRSRRSNWGKLIDYLNALHVDHIVMENAHRPAEELAAFRGLRPEIGLGLGVVDVKSTEIENRRPDREVDRAGREHLWVLAGSSIFIPTVVSGC